MIWSTPRCGSSTCVERGALAVDPQQDFRAAATLARAVRRNDNTVGSLTDCLIAAVTLRHDTTVWHSDADYVRIADATGLSQCDLR